MCNLSAYGTFIKKGTNIFRTLAYIQWGDSRDIIGACVMCNPGSASLGNANNEINEDYGVTGLIKIDPTMQQIINLVQKLYEGKELKGIFYIYNLFTLQNASMQLATKIFEDLDDEESILLKNHNDFTEKAKEIPWILIGWGCENKQRILSEKAKWLETIRSLNIKYLGIEGREYPNYLNPLQHGEENKRKYIEDMVKKFNEKNILILPKENHGVNNKHHEVKKTDIQRARYLDKINDIVNKEGFNSKCSSEIMKLCIEGIKANPKRMELYMWQNMYVINCLMDYNWAIKNCDKAIKVNNKYIPVYLQKNEILELQNNKVEALMVIDEALKVNQNDLIQCFYNGKVAEYKGRWAEAIINYKKAISILDKISDHSPEDKEFVYTISRSLGLVYKNSLKFREACKQFDQALKVRASSELLLAKADILYRLEMYYECMEACYRVKKLDSVHKVWKIYNELFDNSKREIGLDDSLSIDDWVPIEESLNSLIGLENVKKEIKSIVNYLSYERKRSQTLSIKRQQLSYHFMFTGNPGTGKTTVARLLGQILVQAGVLNKGHVVEVDRSNIVGQYVGETAKLTRQAIDKAMDGILFIDEAYSLNRSDSGNDYGPEAIDTLVKAMEDLRGRFVVILAGYTKEMQNLMKVNPGLKSRINTEIEFWDYNDEELIQIAKKIAGENHYKLNNEAERAFLLLINAQKIDFSFANARTVRNIIEKAIREKAYRIGTSSPSKEDLTVLKPLDFGIDLNKESNDTVEEILEELNSMVGLREVKNIVNKIVNYIHLQKRRREMGFRTEDTTINMFFTGNPGTGKTTVARMISRLFKAIGLLKKGQLIEVSREDLIGQYVGQTAPKTLEKIKEAYGGVLFIDEAYSLVQGGENDFGKEAIATLIKEMEDNKDKLAVIMAGYTSNMNDLININPGLSSRIGFTIEFPDYTSKELFEIFKSLCVKDQYLISKKAEEKVFSRINEMWVKRDKNFGNARLVRQFFEAIKMHQASRVIKNNLDGNGLITILPEDII